MRRCRNLRYSRYASAAYVFAVVYQGGRQMSSAKKMYVQPIVELLGSIAEKTEAGSSPNSDQLPFLNNTAFPPPS